MDRLDIWTNYKSKVQGSREVLLWPWLLSNAKSFKGVGVDLGCGDGEYTERVAALAGDEVVGFDSDLALINIARKKSGAKTRYICADITTDVIRSVFAEASFAFSVCCFPHISDELCNQLIRNLCSDLKVPKRIAIVVPHILWAKNNYENVEAIASGIKADARFGGRQWFREQDWYINTFLNYGISCESVLDLIIPDDPRLEKRYRDNAGSPLFLAMTFGER
ncbi:MAG TPA: class I SAM-dependent methyltransferase [Gammaproteobacteria bacterium]|jgi:trans-aconitate methyltransferase|nr:class I SAM-dependent methyltransferase [Gammaproteobacteria bacterium]